MREGVTAEDVGKPVVRGDDRVGRVVDYQNETAFVDPNPGLAETIAAKLGIEDRGKDAFALYPEQVDTVTDDAVRLKTEL